MVERGHMQVIKLTSNENRRSRGRSTPADGLRAQSRLQPLSADSIIAVFDTPMTGKQVFVFVDTWEAAHVDYFYFVTSVTW